MTDDSDSDTRPGQEEEEDEVDEESSEDESTGALDDEDQIELDEANESNEDSEEEGELEDGSSKKELSKTKDSKPAQDITTVALERTIFVGNLPSKLDHRDVAKLFKSCGPVESARIRSVVPEKEKLSPKVALITKRMHPKVGAVNAYVVFAKTDNDECIKKALAMNGTVIDDHHIRVDRAQQPNSRRLTLTSRKKSVFVGNLRFDLRDDDLINHFNKVGSVDYIRLVRDRATGLGKGFGFVKFMERAAVKKALELNDTDFKGRKMRVKKVDEKMKLDDDKKPSREPMKKKSGSNDEQQEDAQQKGPNKRTSFGKGKQTARSKHFDKSKQTDSSRQPNRAGQRTFDNRKLNLSNSKQKNRNSNFNNHEKRVKFDLKNTQKSGRQQKQEGGRFDKVRIAKINKAKKNITPGKKVKKG